MLQRPGDLPDLTMGIAARGPINVEGAVLVGDPAEQRRGLELSFRDERSAGPAAEQEDVDPAGVVGDDKCVRLQCFALDPRPDSGDQAGVPQKSWWPAGAAEQGFRQQVRRDIGKEQADQAGQPQPIE